MTNPERVYCAVLRLYPRAYREEFGGEMLQTFVDWHEDTCDAHGSVPIGYWLAMLSDEVRSIARERVASIALSDFLRPVPLVALVLFLLFVTAIAGAPAAIARAEAAPNASPRWSLAKATSSAALRT